MDIFGEDYPTRDGTCVRDYIQVTDLVDAHLAALAYLRQGGASLTCNCGYGHGSTVKEVVDVVKRVSGVDFTVNHVGRRAGDPAAIVAKAERVRRALGWRPNATTSTTSSGRRWIGNGACITGATDRAARDRWAASPQRRRGDRQSAETADPRRLTLSPTTRACANRIAGRRPAPGSAAGRRR